MRGSRGAAGRSSEGSAGGQAWPGPRYSAGGREAVHPPDLTRTPREHPEHHSPSPSPLSTRPPQASWVPGHPRTGPVQKHAGPPAPAPPLLTPLRASVWVLAESERLREAVPPLRARSRAHSCLALLRRLRVGLSGGQARKPRCGLRPLPHRCGEAHSQQQREAVACGVSTRSLTPAPAAGGPPDPPNEQLFRPEARSWASWLVGSVPAFTLLPPGLPPGCSPGLLLSCSAQ